MISGIFSAQFITNQKTGGPGVAVFSGNVVHGGDALGYFRGKYTLDERNLISGTIEVFKYPHNSTHKLVYDKDNFELILNGQEIVNDKEFELSGQVVGDPKECITIVLKKIDDLIGA